MARSSKLRNFFSRIKSFLTRKQVSRVEKSYSQTVAPVPPPPPVAKPPTRPSVADAKPRDAASRGDVAPPAERRPEEIKADLARIAELKRIEADAKREREQMEGKVAAQEPPVRDLKNFRRREGFQYSTWFKAFGTFGDLRDLGDSPALLGDMEELEDFDVPAAFYSSSKLGKVKWNGVRDREDLIRELNKVSEWAPEDFRDVYPRWEYRYYRAEMVGDVVVAIYEHKARQPLDRKSIREGYRGA